ncbi:hypothetical protein GCM10012275_07720 [Longimycelium tulufanense]|uniref:Thioredoxin domain-containing protein n=1 Tax=Longimycelium tulufanense TaxID=907463 RepID=A0A8J3CAB5_9PSEU|nr:hypothetical protein [Longimycelium tulufanense]GGM39268.1 hypothetical protein GCM10012275_07720 [Longimycelium tulufanense]
MQAGRWVTFFGQDSCLECRTLHTRITAWCKDNGANYLYKEAGHRVIEEYNLPGIPTLRYYDHDSGEPRTELVGLVEIANWMDNN